jgi:hypothetical protein
MLSLCCQFLVSHLDSLAVKVKCRLSYNFANEERHRRPAHRRHINLPVDCCAGNKQLLVSSWCGCCTRSATSLGAVFVRFSMTKQTCASNVEVDN